MFTPKAEIQKTLSALGYYCRQGSQAVFADGQVPAITFRIDNNNVNLDLDNEIVSQDVTVNVDIFADDSVTASTVLAKAEIAMRVIGYRLSYSTDVPQPEGAMFHINATFDGVKG